jgi:hypothetical protein
VSPTPPLRRPDPDLSRLVCLVGSEERAALAAIVEALPGRTDAVPTATLAVRWALRELSARLGLEETARRRGPVSRLTGPLTRPPK